MSSATLNQRLSQLLVVLDRLAQLHEGLHELIRKKTDCMRRGDTEGLRALRVNEEALVKTIQDQEGLRRQLMDAIGRGFGISPQTARGMSLRQLAERLEGAWRSRLLDMRERLHRVVAQVAQVNRLADLIAHQVLYHLRCIFEAVAAPEESPATYSPRGRTSAGGTRTLFEMTG